MTGRRQNFTPTRTRPPGLDVDVRTLAVTEKRTADCKARDGEIVLVDLVAAGENITVTAPPAKPNAQFMVKVCSAAGGFAVTIQPDDDELINGSATGTISANYGWRWYWCDGTDWLTLSSG